MKFRPGLQTNTWAWVIFNCILLGPTHECTETSDSAHQSPIGGLVIPHEEQCQDHPDKRNDAGSNDDRIECVRPCRLAHISEISNQFECHDRPQPRARTAEAAHRRYRVAVKQV